MCLFMNLKFKLIGIFFFFELAKMMYIFRNKQSPCTRCAKGETINSIYIESVPQPKDYKQRNELMDPHTVQWVFPPVMKTLRESSMF